MGSGEWDCGSRIDAMIAQETKLEELPLPGTELSDAGNPRSAIHNPQSAREPGDIELARIASFG
jgi:hypothetical protein